jgi:hypothetical protein
MIPEMASYAPCLLRPKSFCQGMRLRAGLYFLIFIFFIPFPLKAQSPQGPPQQQQRASAAATQPPPPGLMVAADTVIEPQRRIHSPLKATMLSAALPGMGQVYNRKYWKLPILYGLYGGIFYSVNFNNTEYQRVRRAWIARVDGNPNTIDEFPAASTDRLERAMNYYRRNLELTYILAAGLYILNILDATVDAHLLDFDVGDDLTINIRPVMINSGAGGQNAFFGSAMAPGIGLSFRF